MSVTDTGITKKGLARVLNMIEEFRKVYPDMQMQTAAIFINVALNEPITMKDIQNRTGTVQATVSRNISLLSEEYDLRRKRYGFGLVKTEEDPVERRRKIVTLTHKGRQVVEALCSYVNFMD